MGAAEDALALPKTATGFMLPLGAALFKLAAPATWTAGTMFIAWFYNVPMHAPQLFTIALASVFLGFASPGIHAADSSCSPRCCSPWGCRWRALVF